MEQSNVNIYVDYFRRLAMAHAEIKHNPASEENDSTVPDLHFVRWDSLQVLAGLRTKVKYPLLIIELYKNNLDAAVEYDIRQRPVGVFTVLDRADPNKAGDQERVYAKTERIVNELLQQIWADHYKPGNHGCKSPFKDFLFNEITIEPTGKLFDNDFGWVVEFPFEFQKKYNIAKAPDEGVFDTVYILGFQNEWLGQDGAFLGWRP
jgi:hypothetical protein